MMFSDQKRGSRRPEQSGSIGASTTPVAPTGSPGLAGATADRSKRLVVHELTVEFGGLLALDGVSMSAGYGETVGVIGPNGAGKTTLFNVICGFTRARSGTIAFDGVGLENARPHDLNRLGLARTLQGVGLCNGLTVLENVMLGAQARLRSDIGSAFLGLGRSSGEERRVAAGARQLLERLDIDAYASRFPAALPYGIQKRTALARALIAAPSMLLLDEPASGLSDQEIDDLATLIEDLKKDMGIVLVEHRIDLVTAVCDRIVVLNFGHVIADGTPDQIRVNTDVATAYLGADVETAVIGPSAQEHGSA
jgi:branched-chain amino acid transport system ATP-binding protein